jgi:hypothetical protein
MLIIMRFIFFVALLVCITACNVSSPVPQQYVLESLPPVASQSPQQNGQQSVTIFIGKMVLPAYLNRLPIVRRNGNRVLLDDSQRWAEPLADAVPRVLENNFITLMPDASFLLPPWKQEYQFNWRVLVRIDRLEAVNDELVELDARWTILDNKSKTVLNRQLSLVEPIVKEKQANGDMNAIVTSHNAVLVALGRAISVDLRALPKP